MPTRLLLAAAALAAAAGVPAPASATVVCSTAYITKDTSFTACVPYGSPLPPLGCPVHVFDALIVCEFPY